MPNDHFEYEKAGRKDDINVDGIIEKINSKEVEPTSQHLDFDVNTNGNFAGEIAQISLETPETHKECIDIHTNNNDSHHEESESSNKSNNLQQKVGVVSTELEIGIGKEMGSNCKQATGLSASSNHQHETMLEDNGTSDINKDEKGSSEDFVFNLEDIEESETVVDQTAPQKSNPESPNQYEGIIFRNDDLDKEIEGFHNKKESKISELLKEKLSDAIPRLSGTPDDVVDLETGITKPKEIVTLRKRFDQHTAKNYFHRNKVHVK